jgi:deoxycytidylate deaminase
MVVRFDKEGKLLQSKPCIHCFNLIKDFGIKKIYYSNDKGSITCSKVNTFVCSHVSWGFKKHNKSIF